MRDLCFSWGICALAEGFNFYESERSLGNLFGISSEYIPRDELIDLWKVNPWNYPWSQQCFLWSQVSSGPDSRLGSYCQFDHIRFSIEQLIEFELMNLEGLPYFRSCDSMKACSALRIILYPWVSVPDMDSTVWSIHSTSREVPRRYLDILHLYDM